MKINKLTPAYPGMVRRIGRTSCVRLFFSGFGQDPLAFEYLLNHTVNSLTEKRDPWIKDDLANSPDIFMISGYSMSDLLFDNESTNAPLAGSTKGITVDNSSLEALSDSGVEITVHGAAADFSGTSSSCREDLSDGCDPMSVLQRIIDAYESVEIFAWSFGVRAARSIIERLSVPEGKICFASAMGGTVAAVDPVYGIDPRVYSLTLRRLNADTFRDFQYNMCMPKKGRSEDTAAGEEVFAILDGISGSKRSEANAECLKEELRALPLFPLTDSFDTAFLSADDTADEKIQPVRPKLIYNQALICDADAIFRPSAQLKYWRSYKSGLDAAGFSDRFEVLLFPIPHLYPQALLNALIAAEHRS